MQHRHLVTIIFALLCALPLHTASAESDQTIEHIVFLWLNQPGDPIAQDLVIRASQSLKTIPGVINIRSGKAAPSRRRVVDSSYDVAMIISFTDMAALKAYRNHPTHKKILKEILVPLVSRIKVYDMM